VHDGAAPAVLPGPGEHLLPQTLISSGSSPSSSGFRVFSMTVAVAPPPSPASPMPIVPSSVSISTSSAPRAACTPAALA